MESGTYIATLEMSLLVKYTVMFGLNLTYSILNTFSSINES